MKDVTAAILTHHGKLLIARRRADERHPNQWEFPGGKVEAGESPEAALTREMEEEFGVEVAVDAFYGETTYTYGHAAIRLLAYRTRWLAGSFALRVHEELRWVDARELDAYDFLPADRPLVQQLIKEAPRMPSKPDTFSPSANHHHLMNDLSPRYHFTGQEALQPWQEDLRREVGACLGMAQMPAERVPLNVRSIWKREHELGTIEKIIFTSEPFADVPAYLCLPKGVEPPYPTWICLQGHSTGAHVSIAVDREDETTPMKTEGDRDFGLGCMARGMAALCIEQRAFGLRREQRIDDSHGHGGCYQAAMHAMLLGRTLVGERVYDVDRAIDYLETRDDIDLSTLGVMGNSGGGTVTLFAAAVLPRVMAAMPSCYVCTFKHSIMSIFHCLDNYPPGMLRVAEMADILGCFAPRPLTIVAGKDDPIFPLAGVHEAWEQIQRIYSAAGAADRCRLVIGEGGHRFYAEQGWEAMHALQR